MAIAKIIFEPMSLEENIELIKWAYFEDNEALNIHEYTLQCFPELSNISQELPKDEIYDLIQKIVSTDYEKNKDIIFNEVQRYNKIWEVYNDKYFNVLTKLLNIDFPKNLKIIRATVGIIPVFPRYLDSYGFSISTDLDEKKIIETCAHETCHFLWFEKWKQLYPDCSRKEYESPYIPWQYSEMVVDPILNSKEISHILNIKEKAYDSFYQIKDNNNMSLMDVIKDIYNRDMSIEEKIQKGYDYVCSVLKK